MASIMGSIELLMSDILSCFIILKVSVTFIKHSLKQSLMRLSIDNIFLFSTNMIFRLASLSKNNDLKGFQNPSLFQPLAGPNYCNRHVVLFFWLKNQMSLLSILVVIFFNDFVLFALFFSLVRIIISFRTCFVVCGLLFPLKTADLNRACLDKVASKISSNCSRSPSKFVLSFCSKHDRKLSSMKFQ